MLSVCDRSRGFLPDARKTHASICFCFHLFFVCWVSFSLMIKKKKVWVFIWTLHSWQCLIRGNKSQNIEGTVVELFLLSHYERCNITMCVKMLQVCIPYRPEVSSIVFCLSITVISWDGVLPHFRIKLSLSRNSLCLPPSLCFWTCIKWVERKEWWARIDRW